MKARNQTHEEEREEGVQSRCGLEPCTQRTPRSVGNKKTGHLHDPVQI